MVLNTLIGVLREVVSVVAATEKEAMCETSTTMEARASAMESWLRELGSALVYSRMGKQQQKNLIREFDLLPRYSGMLRTCLRDGRTRPHHRLFVPDRGRVLAAHARL